jgi:peptidoglycan LD-endopeptidase LytH
VRSALIVLAVGGAAVSLGCHVVIEHAADSARDTSVSDTTIVLSSWPVPVETASVHPPPIVSKGEVVDSPLHPSTIPDLEVLSAELMIPLPDVQPSDLRDTFNELRGGGSRKHEALDILAPRGTPVLSASAGRVLKLHNSRDGGLMVYAADASDRFVLMYAHLDHYADGLQDGHPLRQGQVIGYVGTTGNAPPNTPHLHFAISDPKNGDVKLWWTGTAIDPRPLLRRPATVQ